MKVTLVIAALGAASLAACSWGIKLDSGGEKVRVAWDGNVGGCRDAGKVTVSVLDRVGPVDRSGLKVSDELEIMARNEAAGLGADTIRPLGEPRDGAQSWGAYSCGNVVRVPVRRTIARAWLTAHRSASAGDVLALIESLFQGESHEEKTLAAILLADHRGARESAGLRCATACTQSRTIGWSPPPWASVFIVQVRRSPVLKVVSVKLSMSPVMSPVVAGAALLASAGGASAGSRRCTTRLRVRKASATTAAASRITLRCLLRKLSLPAAFGAGASAVLCGSIEAAGAGAGAGGATTGSGL